MTVLLVNGRRHEVEAAPDTPLLWVLRERLGLTGSKYGCGIGACGACTVLLEGQPLRSCVTPVAAVAERELLTIEGLGGDHPVQQAWVEAQVPQCGFCQSGQIMAAVALLKHNPQPDGAALDAAFASHLCRCGTYRRIRRAVLLAARRLLETTHARKTTRRA